MACPPHPQDFRGGGWVHEGGAGHLPCAAHPRPRCHRHLCRRH